MHGDVDLQLRGLWDRAHSASASLGFSVRAAVSASPQRSLTLLALLRSTPGKRPGPSGGEKGAGPLLGSRLPVHPSGVSSSPLFLPNLSLRFLSLFAFLIVSPPVPDTIPGVRLPLLPRVPRTPAESLVPQSLQAQPLAALTPLRSGRNCFPRSASPCSPTSHSCTRLLEPARSESPVTTRIMYLPISASPLEGPERNRF